MNEKKDQEPIEVLEELIEEPPTPDEGSLKKPVEPKRKGLSIKAKILISVILIIGIFIVALYVPNPEKSIAEELRGILLNATELPGNRFLLDKKSEQLEAILSMNTERNVDEDFKTLSAFKRILYNFEYFSLKFLPLDTARSIARVIPNFENSILVQYRLVDVSPDFKHKGRSVRTVEVMATTAPGHRFKVKWLKPLDYFDAQDAETLLAIFKKLYDDSKVDLAGKYNKLLDIAALSLKHYDQYVVKSQQMDERYMSVYKTYCNYLQFKKRRESQFPDTQITELIRCFLYDSEPLSSHGKLELQSFINKLNQYEAQNLTSRNAYQLSMFLKKYARKMEDDHKKGIITLLLVHPESYARENLMEWFLNEEPGVIVDYLDTVDQDYFAFQDGTLKEEDARSFLLILYDLFRKTPYISLKRQSLITMYRLKSTDPRLMKKAIQEAKQEKSPRLANTVTYLLNRAD